MKSELPQLIDSFGRIHNNLRISVTDRCNIRCVYCMPEKVEFLPREQLLSYEEIVRFVRVAAPLGIDKIRLTGGEPLLRKDVDVLVRKLVEIEGIVGPIDDEFRRDVLRRINCAAPVGPGKRSCGILPKPLLPSRHPPFDEVRLLWNELWRPSPATWLLRVIYRQFGRESPFRTFLRLLALGSLGFKFLLGCGESCLCPLPSGVGVPCSLVL